MDTPIFVRTLKLPQQREKSADSNLTKGFPTISNIKSLNLK